MSYYPNNTLTNYKTKLASDVALQGEWEVGLSEIIFPKNWLNLREDQMLEVWLYTIKYPPGIDGYDAFIYETPDDELSKHDRIVRVVIPKGQYKNVESLVNEINQHIDDELKWFYLAGSVPKMFKNNCRENGFVRFIYNENTKMVKVNVMRECELRLSSTIIEMLGFTKDDFPVNTEDTSNSKSLETNRMSTLDIDYAQERSRGITDRCTFGNVAIYEHGLSFDIERTHAICFE